MSCFQSRSKTKPNQTKPNQSRASNESLAVGWPVWSLVTLVDHFSFRWCYKLVWLSGSHCGHLNIILPLPEKWPWILPLCPPTFWVWAWGILFSNLMYIQRCQERRWGGYGWFFFFLFINMFNFGWGHNVWASECQELLISGVWKVYIDGAYVRKPGGFWLGNLVVNVASLLGYTFCQSYLIILI